MPYKDKVAQKEYNKERMRKARVAHEGSTIQGSTERVAQVEMFNGKPRYVTLSDGENELCQK